MKKLIRKHWKFVSQLRSGHTALNGQKKYGFKTRNCIQCKEKNDLEVVKDVHHFVCDCKEYSAQRSTMEAECIIIDQKYCQLFIANNNELLYNLLFPYQDDLMDTNINRDLTKKKMCLQSRIEILRVLCKFILGTNKYGSAEK